MLKTLILMDVCLSQLGIVGIIRYDKNELIKVFFKPMDKEFIIDGQLLALLEGFRKAPW